MIQIRHGVFETNSSSTHSLTMMMKDDYDKWINDNVFYYKGSGWCYPDDKKPINGKLYTKEECIDFLKASQYPPSEDINWDDESSYLDYLRTEDFYNSDYEDEYFASYYNTFTTPSGEIVVAFGQYGLNS